MGAKPKYLNAHFDAPSMWATIGLISAKLVNMSNKLFNHISENDKNIGSMADRATVSYAEPLLQSLGERVDKLSKSIRLLNDAVESIIDEQEAASSEDIQGSVKRQSEGNTRRRSGENSSSSSSGSDYSDGSLITQGTNLRRTVASMSSEPLPTQQFLSNNDRLAQIEKDIQSLKALKDGIAVNLFIGLQIVEGIKRLAPSTFSRKRFWSSS